MYLEFKIILGYRVRLCIKTVYFDFFHMCICVFWVIVFFIMALVKILEIQCFGHIRNKL